MRKPPLFPDFHSRLQSYLTNRLLSPPLPAGQYFACLSSASLFESHLNLDGPFTAWKEKMALGETYFCLALACS